MRMWMVDPRILCRSHLLGEHAEIHKHRHNFVSQHRIDGRVGHIEPMSMAIRHDQLVEEMVSRGYVHRSPYTLPDLSYLPDQLRLMTVDANASLNELIRRCSNCRQRNNSLLKIPPIETVFPVRYVIRGIPSRWEFARHLRVLWREWGLSYAKQSLNQSHWVGVYPGKEK